MFRSCLFTVLYGLLAISTQAAFASNGYTEFEVVVYGEKTCSPSSKKTPAIKIDANVKCNSYSYADSVGKITTGSQGNIRCYPNKVVMDKYPFSGTCNSKEKIINLNHEVIVGECMPNPSHEGTVYEKLEKYQYPGNENCRLKSK
jgi:hypothetical protein